MATMRIASLRAHIRLGPVLMATASLAFVLMTLGIKLARSELSGPEVVLWRGLLSLPLLALLSRGQLQIRRRRVFATRLLLGFAAMTAYAVAARGLDLVDLDLVGKLRPLLIAFAAPLLLGRGERSGRGLWLVLVLGFAGCAVLLAPRLTVGSWYAVWALAAIVLSAAAHLCLRALAGESSRAIVFWFHAGVAVLAAVTIPLSGGAYRLPPVELWPVLVGVAVAATTGQLLMTRAYALDRAPVIAAMTYLGPVWAVLADVTVFGAIPGPHVVVGGVLVIGASAWVVVRGAGPPEEDGALPR
jgi:S-adenosylmethionine uptake transporter